MRNFVRSIVRFVVGKLLPRWAYPIVRGPLKGARIILGSLAGEGGGATVYFNMAEPEQTEAFINSLKNGQVYFDVGANVGYYTILGSRCVGSSGKVIAFEPVIRNLVYLYQHIHLNKANNVVVISAACSDVQSLAHFSSGKNFAEGHIVIDTSSRPTINEKVSLVPTVTIDAFTKQFGILPDLIKIDVEGAELSVLKGARNTLCEARPKVLLSTHSDLLRSSCLAYLQDLGYTVKALSLNKDNPTEFLAQYPKV